MPVILDAQAGRKVLIELRPSYGPTSSAQLSAIGAFLDSCLANNVIADVALWPDPVITPLTQAQFFSVISYYGPAVRSRYPLVYAGTISPVAGQGDLTTFQNYFPSSASVDKVTASYYVPAWAAGIRLDPYAAIADHAGLPFGLHAAGVASSDSAADGYGYMTYLANFFAARFQAGQQGDVLYDQESPYVITSGSYLVPLYDALFDAVTLGTVPVLPPPPPPGPPPPPTFVPVRTDWAFVLGPVQPVGGHTIALSGALSRRISVRSDPGTTSEIALTIRGTDPTAALIAELTTDVQAYRGGQLLGAFRIIPTEDTLDANGHMLQVTGRDYREVLRRRECPGITYTSTVETDIAWRLIQSAQSDDGGDLGIIPGHGAHTGTVRTMTYTPQDMVSDKIDELAQMDGGFDWDITAYGPADLRLDTWYPNRGTDRGVVLEWGSAVVASMDRLVDPSTYANSIYMTGDTGTSPVARDAADILTRPEGRWETAIGTTIKNQAALGSRAAFELQAAQVVTPAYTIVLTAGAWDGPSHIWAGDLVRVRINSGRLSVDDPLRVSEITVEPGESGEEKVTLIVGQIPLDPRRVIPSMLRRLKNLEHR